MIELCHPYAKGLSAPSRSPECFYGIIVGLRLCRKIFGTISLAIFVCMMVCGCKTKSNVSTAVMASATIGSMETEVMDTSCKVIQWDVWVPDTMKDTATWVPMVRKTIATKRLALTNARTDAVRKDTTNIIERSVPHGAHASATEKDILQMSPLQLLLYRIGLIVCIFGLFFGISYMTLAYFRKNA